MGGKTRAFALFFVLGFASQAQAQLPPQPAVSIYYQNLTGARINPLGLVNYFRASARFRLFESNSDILKLNYVGIGVVAATSPAWGRAGFLVEVQPLSILQLYAQYEMFGYYGTFNLFASFPTASADYSDSEIQSRANDPGTENYTTLGSMLTLGATLQMKVGPLAVRNIFRAIRSDFDLRNGDRVFYDQIYDMLMPDSGWIVLNDVDVLGLFDISSRTLAAGIRWSYAQAFYNDDHRLPTEEDSPNNRIHRVGPLLALTLRTDARARFNKPTLILLAQWHIRHRWRTGEDVSQALPYVGIAFRFEGDFLAPSREAQAAEEAAAEEAAAEEVAGE
ncbi:MAG: hypothetical protein AAF411_16575 [Myxococcota bacterium]